MDKTYFNCILVLITTALCIPICSSAQYYQGRVIDKNGTPIEKAIIINDSHISADYTDKYGNFCIKAQDGDHLIIHYYLDLEFVYNAGMDEISIDSLEKSTKEIVVDDKVIQVASTLYLSERYKECMAYCMYYDPSDNFYYNIVSEHHPYRNWKEISFYSRRSSALSMATLYYLGALSAYNISCNGELDRTTYSKGHIWSWACAAIIKDYLTEENPDDNWTIAMMNDFLDNGKRGMEACECGEHFLSTFEEDSWVKKEWRWYEKKYNEISELLYRKTYQRENQFSDSPLISYYIKEIAIVHDMEKGGPKYFREGFSRYYDAVISLMRNVTHTYDVPVNIAITQLASILSNAAIDRNYREKAGDNLERFCMEYMIKLQDVAYSVNGSSRYSLSPEFTLDDIQAKLKDDECALIHFEAHITKGMYYSRYELGSRYRNYALIITKDRIKPSLWERGYINDNRVNNLDAIKESFPKAKRFYFVGTPRMSFIDIAGIDSSVVRLHSLSQLLQEDDTDYQQSEVTFIGNIDYGNAGSPLISSHKRFAVQDDYFGPLDGTSEELNHINTLFSRTRPITGDSATRNIVGSEIGRSMGIIHFATHGTTSSNPDTDISPHDLIMKKNVLDNSRLILSGYNDSPYSTLTYISGSDILKIKKIDASIVFLSACLSGSGSVGTAGPVGIAEAFHLIGAKNIICYLEPVDDDIATQFSNQFYDGISNGMSCHDAFFRAKRTVDDNLKIVLWE